MAKPKVLHTRDEVQEIMRDALCAEVERVMGRKMIAFMSDNNVEPDMGVEVFVLEPETASRLVPTGVRKSSRRYRRMISEFGRFRGRCPSACLE